jgi:hypothetical protein
MYSTIQGIVYPFTCVVPHPVKGYIMYSTIQGTVYPFTCVVPHPVKGYTMYSIIQGIVYPFTCVNAYVQNPPDPAHPIAAALRASASGGPGSLAR